MDGSISRVAVPEAKSMVFFVVVLFCVCVFFVIPQPLNAQHIEAETKCMVVVSQTTF